jgi:hypothetical protein
MSDTPLPPWAADELRYADLGDRRLNRRLARLVGDLAARPATPVPSACGSWAATKAAYRFWDNDQVPAPDILAAHIRRTRDRLPVGGDPILAIQDTTVLTFTHHPGTTGLGYLTALAHRGLLVHTTLCVGPDGVPLGLLGQHVWVRDDADFGKRNDRRQKLTTAKESQRWVDGLAQTERAVPADRSVLTVADREADFYDLFAAPRRAGHDLLIRAKSRRCIRDEAGLLGRGIEARPVGGRMRVTIPRANGRAERTATLTLRYGRFTIAPPATHPRRAELPDLRLTVILAAEEDPPAGVTPVRWLLVTTRRVSTRAAAVQVVGWYARRWLIERYNYVLKSGCRVEELQLGTRDRLDRALATYAVVAWRVLWLAYAARGDDPGSCAEALDPDEWRVLQIQSGEEPTESPPDLGTAVRWVARLGGFLGRKADGPPGVRVIWRGLRRLDDLVHGYRLAQNSIKRNPVLMGNG